MIKDFLIKTDNTGRIMIPKEIRKHLNIKDNTKFNVREECNCLYFDVIKNELLMDSFGRILIPKKQRNAYNIVNNESISLSSTPSGFKVDSCVGKYKVLIDKIIFLEENYNFKLVVVNDKQFVYKNRDYNLLEDSCITSVENYFSDKRIPFEMKEIVYGNEFLHAFIIYDEFNKEVLPLLKVLL